MPYRRKRIRRQTIFKTPIKHSNTLIATVGNGSNVTQDIIIQTQAGDRSLDGSNTTIKTQSTTSRSVMVGDVVKYINIVIQSAITEEGQTAQNDTQGWLEWAVVWRAEVDIPIPSTNLGTKTIGDLATAMFRGDCLMTGQFPVSVNLPNVEVIQLKLPKKATVYKLGNVLSLYYAFRSSNVTDLTTDTVRVVNTTKFKAYT